MLERVFGLVDFELDGLLFELLLPSSAEDLFAFVEGELGGEDNLLLYFGEKSVEFVIFRMGEGDDT